MLAHPIPAWNHRQQAFTQNGIVSDLLGRLQAQMQSNIMQMFAGEEGGAESSDEVQAMAGVGSLHLVGESDHIIQNVHTCKVLRHRSRQVVMAMRTAGNRLVLESWRVNADGAVVQTGMSAPQPDEVLQVELARAEKYVVAYRSLTQELHLVSWDVSNTGAIYRAGESEVWREPVRRVRLQALDNELLITACITRSRQLQLITWRVGADAAIVPVGEHRAQLEDVCDVALTVLGHAATGQRIVTATRLKSGAVIHDLWQVTPAGEIETGAQAIVAGPATTVQLTADRNGHLITALRTTRGQLRLLVWRCPPNGNAIHLLSDQVVTGSEHNERIRRLELASINGHVMVSAVTTSSKLKLMLGRLHADGRLELGPETVTPAVALGPMMLCGETLDGNAPLLTGMTTAPGIFKLMTWQIE